MRFEAFLLTSAAWERVLTGVMKIHMTVSQKKCFSRCELKMSKNAVVFLRYEKFSEKLSVLSL